MAEDTITPTAPTFTLEEAIERRDQIAQQLQTAVPQLQQELAYLSGVIDTLQRKNGDGPNRAARRAAKT